MIFLTKKKVAWASIAEVLINKKLLPLKKRVIHKAISQAHLHTTPQENLHATSQATHTTNPKTTQFESLQVKTQPAITPPPTNPTKESPSHLINGAPPGLINGHSEGNHPHLSSTSKGATPHQLKGDLTQKHTVTDPPSDDRRTLVRRKTKNA